MMLPLSPNTQAILLLTAPLIAGRKQPSSELLTPSEYKRLAQFLRDRQRQPADLLSSGANELLRECGEILDGARLARLLGRGFLLSQAVEHWRARAIWLVSRADAEYPSRLKTRLRDGAPPILYGCGDVAALDAGGLAVVGSRRADSALVEYTETVGRLAATAGCALISGGARGIDQAAMRGTLEGGGNVIGVLADQLERQALSADHREVLMDGRMVLISPYDPSAGFNVGHAMQRNKLVYALADAALVVCSDYGKGGTWAGAVEQLDKLRLVPIYVRSNGASEEALEALLRKGALSWPNPATPDALVEAVTTPAPKGLSVGDQAILPLESPSPPSASTSDDQIEDTPEQEIRPSPIATTNLTPAAELFAKVRELAVRTKMPVTDTEMAEELQVSKGQAKAWLRRLVEEGMLEKLSKPTRYRPASSLGPLFDK
ncbi:MAG: DNA-protecting protein DprA [Sedimentisphaerales bacterium]|nr:DNA-protecting protein DprA [Sedimentisphaerales bacterium]